MARIVVLKEEEKCELLASVKKDDEHRDRFFDYETFIELLKFYRPFEVVSNKTEDVFKWVTKVPDNLIKAIYQEVIKEGYAEKFKKLYGDEVYRVVNFAYTEFDKVIARNYREYTDFEKLPNLAVVLWEEIYTVYAIELKQLVDDLCEELEDKIISQAEDDISDMVFEDA